MNDTTPTPAYTVDEAMAEFMKVGSEVFGSQPLPRTTPTGAGRHKDSEGSLFVIAEKLLADVCPDPQRCPKHYCRRQRSCRHFVTLRALRAGDPALTPSRRTPGARAFRYAVWVFMNAHAE